MEKENVLISACLLGISCRYDGSFKEHKNITKLLEKYNLIPICPEQLGGLETPREPAEQLNQKVFTKSGKDVTINFYKGAREGLKLAKIFNCKKAILKAKSPSCGNKQIYDGTFTGKLISGEGVFAKLLKENNIFIFSEKDY
jgi:uncharacterized protein YbbK (DUF523 family)